MHLKHYGTPRRTFSLALNATVKILVYVYPYDFFSFSLVFILGRRVVHINHIWSSLYQSFQLNEIQICKNIFDE